MNRKICNFIDALSWVATNCEGSLCELQAHIDQSEINWLIKKQWIKIQGENWKITTLGKEESYKFKTPSSGDSNFLKNVVKYS